MLYEAYEKVDNKTRKFNNYNCKSSLKYEYDEAHEMVGDIKVPVSRGVGPNFPS